MARILTGIQSSGKPHLGNILGAISQAIEPSKNEKNQSFLFIADLHSLTSIKDPVNWWWDIPEIVGIKQASYSLTGVPILVSNRCAELE